MNKAATLAAKGTELEALGKLGSGAGMVVIPTMLCRCRANRATVTILANAWYFDSAPFPGFTPCQTYKEAT